MKKIIFILLIFVTASYFLISGEEWFSQDNFRLTICDVGQGDSILVVTPNGKTILIDGGPDSSILRCLGKIMPLWRRRIDLVLLTHAHDDHVAGLIEIVKRYKIGRIMIGEANYSSPTSLAWKKLISSSGQDIIMAQRGYIFNFGEGCSLKVLSDTRSEEKDENDYSIISLFSCLGRQVFLTGDAGIKKQEEALEGYQGLKIDILKISHHGSLTGSSEKLLRAINPSLALISVGVNNKFNHPAEDVLNNLANLSISTLRTDQLGSLNFLANNNKIIIKK